MEIAFIVDDNLIGNKKAIKLLLADVAAWQRGHGYPFTFFTEASLDLADDPELLQLMVDANITSVFIGIESTSEESLRETKKFQNVRSGGTLLGRIHAIQARRHRSLVRHDPGFRPRRRRRCSTRSANICTRPACCTRWWACWLPFPRRRCTRGWRPKAGWTSATSRSSAPT